MEGLVKDGDFWTNEKVKVRCGKKGLEESVWKVWKDEEVKDTFEGKGKGKEVLGKRDEVVVVEEGEVMEVDVVEVEEGVLKGIRGRRWK